MEDRCLEVFLVDDEISVVEWLAHAVEWENYGYQVAGYAANPQEALDFMEHHPIDLLITDISMPEMSGLDLIKAVRKRHSETYLIAISAFDQFSYVKEAFRYGIVDYCLKPIDEEELYDSLKTVRILYEKSREIYNNQNTMLLRSSILQRLISSGNNSGHLEEQCRLLGFPLTASVYQILLVEIEDLKKENYLDVIRHFEKMEDYGIYSFFDARMRLVCLFAGEKACEKETLKLIQDVLRRECEVFRTVICVGNPLLQIRQIAQAYEECCDFMDASFLFAESVIRLEEYLCEKCGKNKKDKEIEHLMNNLRSGRECEVMAILKKRLECCKIEKEKKQEFLCLAVDMVRILRQTYPNRNFARPTESLERQKSSDKMLEWWRKFYHTFLAEKVGDEWMHPYVNHMLQEIHQRYGDNSLSLQSMARECHVSAPYLGKLFREQTGEFFNDYLLNVRLKAAEALFVEAQVKMGEISEKVGFLNQSYFNKMFRRVYGISPTAYRRLYYEENRNS